MYGISALDPRVAATDKFIQEKQIPPDKVEDFLLGMGADPKLASLVFKYRKVREAAENQPKAPPMISNVAQDISNQYAQLKQQERMQQGIAAMPVPAIANAPMQGGITGQPVVRAAGGGLIAFDQGGTVPTKSPSFLGRLTRNPLLRRAGYAGLALTGLGALLGDEEKPAEEEVVVEQEPKALTDEQIKALAAADAANASTKTVSRETALPAPPKSKAPDVSQLVNRVNEAKARLPKDEQAAIDAELAREAPYLKSLEARRAALEAQEKKSVTSPEKKFWLAFAQAGFAASAKGARNLWETLSMGGVEGMKAYETMKDKERELVERLQDKKFQIEDLSAQVKRGASKAGIERLDRLTKEYNDAQSELTKTQVAVQLAANSESGQNYRANLQIAAADRRFEIAQANRANKQKLEDQYYADIAAAQRTTDPQLKAAYLARAEDTFRAKSRIEQAESGFQSTQARLAANAAMFPQEENSSGGETYLGSM